MIPSPASTFLSARTTLLQHAGRGLFLAPALLIATTALGQDFAGGIDIGGTHSAGSVTAADLDGDGDEDVLSAASYEGKILWYENLGGGLFASEQVITSQASGASSVYAKDLDGDGDLDVLSASANDNKIAWYENRLNQLEQDFGPQKLLTKGAIGASSVFATDLDGDGDADVLSASSTNNTIAWYKNGGNKQFGDDWLITSNAVGATCVYAADLDGDGDADVLSASYIDDTIAWYENLGNDLFGPRQVLTAYADGARAVHAVDLDGDGDVDVLSASENDDKIAWYENLGGGSFGPQQVISSLADQARSVYAADLDGDGDLDVLSAHTYTPLPSVSMGAITWHENLGGGVFGWRQNIGLMSPGCTSVHATDLDGDGDADVVATSKGQSIGSSWYGCLKWFEQLGPPDCNGNGTPDSQDIASGTSTDCNSNGIPDECEIADDPSLDLDLDGTLDSCQCTFALFCASNLNSTGMMGTIGYSGSASILANDLTLTANNLPTNQIGMFIYGANEYYKSLGDGQLCVGPKVFRIKPVVSTGFTGSVALALNYGALPSGGQVTAFSTWHFQLWYRDPAGGLAGSNTTSGLKVTFCP